MRQNNSEISDVSPEPIVDRELNGLNYISGYVIHKLMKKAKYGLKYPTQGRQEIISLLECTIDNEGNNELIQTLSRGGISRFF